MKSYALTLAFLASPCTVLANDVVSLDCIHKSASGSSFFEVKLDVDMQNNTAVVDIIDTTMSEKDRAEQIKRYPTIYGPQVQRVVASPSRITVGNNIVISREDLSYNYAGLPGTCKLVERVIETKF